ncbi:unnamed protein product [Closterium sp. NIES-64]|nr:unnamed protein product [Closterium sp. NIES-64]
MALRFHGRMGSTAVEARKAAKLSCMSPPAYAQARAAIQNALGVRYAQLLASIAKLQLNTATAQGHHPGVCQQHGPGRARPFRTALSVKSQLSLPQLALQFGCMRVLESTQRNLHIFTARFTAALPEARRGGTDFSRPAYMAAALMLTATRNQLKMDADRLLEATRVGKDEFQQVVASMEAHCADLFGSDGALDMEQCMHAADVAHLHQQRHHQQPQSIAAADVAEHQRSTTSADVAPQSQAPASRSNNRTMPLPQAKLTLLKRPPGRYRVSGPSAMNHHMPHLTCPSPCAPSHVSLPACPSPHVPPRMSLPRVPPRVSLPTYPAPHVSRPVKPTPFVSPCPPRPCRQAVSGEAAL